MDDPNAEYRIKDSDKNELLDRLSVLPDSLILMILALLPMRDVVQTTILSKRWKGLWTTVSCLDFRNSKLENLSKLRNFVCGALALWKGAKILKFCIDLPFDLSFTRDLDSWLHFAIENEVEELRVNLMSVSIFAEESKYYAPQRLYSCSSIRKLSLDYCGLEVGENVQWNQLKSLTLESKESLTHVMNHVISGAPQLEVLNLSFIQIDENLNIRSTSLKALTILRSLDFWSDDEVKDTMLSISAPNLETLQISGILYAKCLLNVPSLTDAFLNFRNEDYAGDADNEMIIQVFRSISGVAKKVTISDRCIKTLLQMKKKHNVVEFSNAEFVKLIANSADGVLDMFPNLVTLIVDLNVRLLLHYISTRHSIVRDCVAIESSPTPSLLHLRRVEITWHMRDETSITRAIRVILENAESLEKMVFHLCCRGVFLQPFAMVEENVVSMPRSSSTAEVMVIQV